MKKVISLLLVMLLLTATLSVSFSAYSVVDVDPETGNPIAMTCAEGIAAYEAESELEPGSIGTQRIYFQMPNGDTGPVATEDVYVHHDDVLDPETGEVITPAYDELSIRAGEKAPTWFNENNVYTDGKHYGGVYWWGGPASVDGQWAGYRMEIADEEQGIYYADIPYDPDDDTASVAMAIFNNGVDGGTDTSKDIYYQAAQTIDSNIQGAWAGDFDSLPAGSPDEWSFDGCILIIDPNQISINEFSGKQTCGWFPYVYYGNGCYGQYFEGCDEYTGDVDKDCCNPDHFKNGVHVGYQGGGEHVHTPGEPVQENVVAANYRTGGSYDEVVYCTGCGEEISRTPKTTEKLVFTPDPNKIYFDAASAGWEMGSKNKIAFRPFDGDIATDFWGSKKVIGSEVANYPGMYEIDLNAKVGVTFTPGLQYKIIFVRTEGNNWTSQTYDLFMTSDCLGHIAYCDGTEYENPVDSDKITLAAFWEGMDSAQYGPVKQISSIGNVVGTCLAEGVTDIDLFNNFLTIVNEKTGVTSYQNALKFTVQAGKKTEQKMIDDIGTALGLTKQDVYDAFAAAEITDSAWDYTVSTLPGEVVPPHTHTPGEPVQENVVVNHDNTTYDSVVYCSECGEEISRTPVEEAIITHTYSFVPAVAATEDAEGCKAHYVCSVCNKLFIKDGDNYVEVTAADLVVPKLDHVHVPAPAVQENVVAATCHAAGSYDEVVYCAACGEEISRTPQTIEQLKHQLKFVPARAATEEADGWKSHFECKLCGDLFADAAAQHPVTWDDIRIPKLVPAVTGLLGDANGDGEVDIVDVTIIQRFDADIKLPASVDVDKMMILGDVNKDGDVNVLDATILQRWLVGLEQTRGIGADV